MYSESHINRKLGNLKPVKTLTLTLTKRNNIPVQHILTTFKQHILKTFKYTSTTHTDNI